MHSLNTAVSSVWTSTSSSRDPETESPEEEEPLPDLVILSASLYLDIWNELEFRFQVKKMQIRFRICSKYINQWF